MASERAREAAERCLGQILGDNSARPKFDAIIETIAAALDAAVAEEREACALVTQRQRRLASFVDPMMNAVHSDACLYIETAIRARGSR